QHARGAVATLGARKRAQRGQQEGGRLAGAGGGGGNEVATFQNQRNGLLLHGGGGVIAQTLNGCERSRGQAEVGKMRHRVFRFSSTGARTLRLATVCAPAPAACVCA